MTTLEPRSGIGLFHFASTEPIMAKQDAYDFLVKYLTAPARPEFAQYSPVRQLLTINQELAKGILKYYVAMESGKVDDDSDMIDALNRIYKDYVEPIDLPVADWIERQLDRQAPVWIASGYWYLVEYAKNFKPEPVVAEPAPETVVDIHEEDAIQRADEVGAELAQDDEGEDLGQSWNFAGNEGYEGPPLAGD